MTPGLGWHYREEEVRALARDHASRTGRPGILAGPIGRHIRRLDAFLAEIEEVLRVGGPGISRLPAREWLLDNRHLILEALLHLRQDLSRGFIRDLPSIRDPSDGSRPRILELARKMVLAEGAHVDLDRLQGILRTYQRECPLTMGELWAFPLVLRLALLEEMARAGGTVAGLEVPGVLRRPAADEDGKVEEEETVSGAIRSLREVAREDWKRFFEAVSRVEDLLRKGDPAGIYSRMDFETRDRYRKRVEIMARTSGRNEEEVVRIALEEAGRHGSGSPGSHVGRVLLGTDKNELERALGCRIPWGTRLRRLLGSVAFPMYAGAVGILGLLVLVALLLPVIRPGGPLLLLLGAIVAVIPALTVGVSVVNWMVPRFVAPRVLPKLSLDGGIPPEWRTAVAVPSMLTGPEEVDTLLAQLEVNFLGNRERNLTFVLLSDFADASDPQVPGEEELLERARKGIRDLNRRHAGSNVAPFLLLHRARRWNPVEERWMGWERKRGKLVEFNGLLLEGNREPFPWVEGDLERLEGVRFVLTLDADTFLPQGAARRLVGALAHPLNRPRFDERGRVSEGYTVLQPRVDILPDEGHRTLFSRVFEADRGLDLYSEAVSDVYQDLLGEGIFTGKGLYDVAAFERSLESRVPDNALLSHDLFEGIHGRAALVSDVVVFEDFPDDIRIWLRRLHRWVRGDWQLVPWLLPRVPSRRGPRVPNRIDLRGRWKILDNLRRSLLAPSLLAFFLAGWFFLPGAPGWWTAAAALVLAVPVLLGSGFVFRARAGMSRRWAFVRDPILLRKSGTLRWILALVFLPHQARIEADAVIRTLWRVAVSRKRLLEWTPAAHAARQARLRTGMLWRWREMAEAPGLALVLTGAFAWTGTLPASAVPLLLAWLLSPAVAAWTARPVRPTLEPELTDQERLLLRSIARRTWSFFEEFVGPEDHWLPPDHFQESPRGAAAHRTSPTNVGLTLTSALAAYDLGYLSLSRLVATLSNTLDGMDRLERHRGHLLNWYDTRRLTTLEPRYVSTVDSGNLAACLLVVARSCPELARDPVLRPEEIEGLLDALRELEGILRGIPPEGLPQEARLLDRLGELREELDGDGEDPRMRRIIRSRMVDEFIPAVEDALGRMVGGRERSLDPSVLYQLRGWIIRIGHQTAGLAQVVDEISPWISLLREAPETISGKSADGEVARAFRELRDLFPPDLCFEEIPGVVEEGWGRLESLDRLLPGEEEEAAWILEMRRALEAGERASRLLTELSVLERRALEWVDRMDFRFLYDRRRRLFHIGFDVSAGRMDQSHYDLLASEARTASFLAAAKGEVPGEHWLHLGRPFGRSQGTAALLSWAGTLFEYLMPALFLRTPGTSLMGVACRSAVDRHIAFASRHRIPWGISESSYHHLDTQGTYQYRAFGVPELAIRREMGDRLVVAPYATVLALPFRPRAARENLKRLVAMGMLGPHGLYEAVDFGVTGRGKGGQPAIVRSFMAHHQGMILMAVANYLGGERMVERFHRDPRTAAASYLLHERAPGHVRLERPLPHSAALPEAPGRPRAVEDWSPRPDREHPSIHVLSNGSLSVLATARGGGGIRWQDRALTRWRIDPSADHWGSWVYVRDQDRELLWATTPEPVPVESEGEAVVFGPHRVEYRRKVQGIQSRTTVLVPREDNVEIRQVILTNTTRKARRLRVAGYGEPSLAEVGEDRRHPAFQKLFVEAEWLAEARLLHFRRRRAAPEEPRVHLAHGLGSHSENVRLVGWETDREAFLGRGGRSASPGILMTNGAGTKGRSGEGPGRDPGASAPFHATLDPVHSLILDVDLPRGGEATITFLTAVGRSRDEALAQLERFRSPGTVVWAEERARIAWGETLHRLEIPPGDVRGAQKLLSAVIHPFHELRTTEPPGQPYTVHRRDALWGLGISGDHPVVLLRITHLEQEERLDQMLRYHALWLRMGVRGDLVVLDETAEGYQHPIRDRIVAGLARLGIEDVLHRPGGVHHVPVSRLDPVHRAAVEAVAQVRIDATLGPAEGQLERLDRDPIRLPPFVPVTGWVPDDAQVPDVPRPQDLSLDNGFGGFTPDGREYVIHPRKGEVTPAPWINVVGTPELGFTVSETGSGYSWAGNSAENRLTSWSNDPVLDRTGEALYLRDEETGAIWSPTPGPAPADGAYQCRHGAGYTRFLHRSHGLEQETELFASLEPAAKVWALQLRNRTDRPRRITVTFFSEWTLGGSREREAPHLVGRFHYPEQVLLAENRFVPPSGPPVAFLAADRPLHGWTMDRQEFLGRGGPEDPAGLHRIGLGEAVGGALDPCGTAQVHVNLEAQGEARVHFFLGAGSDEGDAVRRVRELRRPGAVARVRKAVDMFWESLLSRTRVSTPEPALDLTVNRWALYQALSCRLWGRSALYQSAGAYGFRDQLQDVLALVGIAPGIARDHILEAARHQFVEGDVLHWWHPPEARGIRSRCSDDLLWLPFATAAYVRGSGDWEILDRQVSFLEGAPLADGEQERYGTYARSQETGTLHDHCLRALRRGLTQGPNGLPLIGLSDWNDGMDRLGRKGRGESVWLAWFAGATARTYAEICRKRDDPVTARELDEEAEALARAVESFAWDGAWYLRATHDDGSVVGSAEDPECQIDSIAQSWAVISGLAEPERTRTAMDSVLRELVDDELGLVLLLSPPFDKDPRWPGYIRAYPPGVRENGGQYSHAGTWVGFALAALGRGDDAIRVFRYLCPISRAVTPEAARHYRVEPYAVAGDIGGPPQHAGRGGWSWFTGSAAWLHRLGLEAILGIRPHEGGVRVDPCIPPDWPSFEVELRRGSSRYLIRVMNPDGVSRGVRTAEVDGEPISGDYVPLPDDGAEHHVRVVMGR
ncbi:MAG: glucoamylase family protein [Gemmatimonadota bacterium]